MMSGSMTFLQASRTRGRSASCARSPSPQGHTGHAPIRLGPRQPTLRIYLKMHWVKRRAIFSNSCVAKTREFIPTNNFEHSKDVKRSGVPKEPTR
jgi:hypothetical protein